MFREALRPVWAEIDLNCIKHNITSIFKLVDKTTTEVIGVVKADAYGHGAVPVSRVLLENGVSSLAVATISEAITLRSADITCPILMLGLTPSIYLEELLRYNLTPIMASSTEALQLSDLAVTANKEVEILIAVETGMGRIGLMPTAESLKEIKAILELPNIRIKGIFSHFATADESDKAYSYGQLKIFENFYEDLEKAGVPISFKTHANSAALLELPGAHFDAVRPGIILYGCYPSNKVNKNLINLKPSMSLKANILFIKKVPAGYSISYGRKFITERESFIATLPIGYADGYPRSLSGNGRVIVKGEYAPIVGNICMDQCMIDVTDIPNVQLYDEVVLIGTQGNKKILADEIAEKTSTINYEIVCRIGQRVPRVYVSSNTSKD